MRLSRLPSASLLLALCCTLTPCRASANQVSDAKKREFIELLKTLPHKGEFFTDESVRRAGPYLPVLFALTDKDIEGYDLYPFAALSAGLGKLKEHREYAVKHFAEIRHPELRLCWGVMLFGAGDASTEIVHFLRDALKSEEQAKLLSEILGPDFEAFKKQVMAY